MLAEMYILGLLNLLLSAPVLAAIFAVAGRSIARPDRRIHMVLLWLLAGLTLPAVPLVSFIGFMMPLDDAAFPNGFYDSYQTPLGHGYNLISIDSSDAPPSLFFPGEVGSGWPVARVGCAGKDILLQAGDKDSWYGHLTTDGKFSEMNDISALGPVTWSPEGKRDIPAACEPEPETLPKTAPWRWNVALLMVVLPFCIWLGPLLFLSACWHK